MKTGIATVLTIKCDLMEWFHQSGFEPEAIIDSLSKVNRILADGLGGLAWDKVDSVSDYHRFVSLNVDGERGLVPGQILSSYLTTCDRLTEFSAFCKLESSVFIKIAGGFAVGRVIFEDHLMVGDGLIAAYRCMVCAAERNVPLVVEANLLRDCIGGVPHELTNLSLHAKRGSTMNVCSLKAEELRGIVQSWRELFEEGSDDADTMH